MTDHACWELAAAALGGRQALDTIGLPERDALLGWAIRHRLTGLLWRVAGPSGPGAPSGAVRDAWLDAACRQTAYAVHQEQELRRAVDALAKAGLSPILFKGSALAYTLYADAALRPGADHDLLIRPDDAGRVRSVFDALGYEPELQRPARQAVPLVFRRTDTRGIRYLFDVHQKISTVLVYADRLAYDEIRSDAVPMPRLDLRALAPAPVHSLLIACVHRLAHHADTDDLLWLYDIHLLAQSLTEAEWERALALAEAKQWSAILLRGLERAHAIGPSAPALVLERLRGLASREPPAVGAGLLIDVILSDWRTLPTSRDRLRWLRDHLMPPAAYMRRLYPGCPAPLLPFAYAYRIARGAPAWFRRR